LGFVMNWFTGIIVYVLVWWVALFAILPLWVVPSQPGELGHAAGAPKQPLLARKILVTSLVAGVIWIGIYLLVRSPWISFRRS
jgi:predicted secreted protein